MRIVIVDTNNLDFVSNDEDYLLMVNVLNRHYEIGGVHFISPKSEQ